MNISFNTKARIATKTYFLICGVCMASWAAMVPYVKTRLGLDDAQIGLILLCFGGGAMLTMPFTGLLINRVGSRAVMLLAAVLNAVLLLLLSMADNVPLLSVILLLFGGGIGILDVGMNAHAVLVERAIGRPIMSSIHGLFSVGGLVGAFGISAILSGGAPLTLCIGSVSAAVLLLALWQFLPLLPRKMDDRVEGSTFLMPRGYVLLLGVLTLIAFLAEGAVLDWGAIFLHFERDIPKANAGYAYAVFSVAMAAGRLSGDWIAQRLAGPRILQYGSAVAIVGYLIVITVPHISAALIGFTLVGLGLSNLVPVIFSALGALRNPPPSMTIPIVTTIGYTGMLSGPAAIGLASNYVGLPMALGGVTLLLFLVLLKGTSLAKPKAEAADLAG
jgi:fucose permease